MNYAIKRKRLALSLATLAVGYIAFLLVQDTFRELWEGLTSEELTEIARVNSQSHWIAVGMLGTPTIWWHLVDVVNRFEPSSIITRLISSYRFVISILIFGLAGASILFSGLTEYLQCRSSGSVINSQGNEFGFFCTSTPGLGVELLFFLPTLLLIFLALAKTVQAITPLFKKAK